MVYNLMLSLIKAKRKSKEELTKKANVFYANNQLSDEQYTEIMGKIEELD